MPTPGQLSQALRMPKDATVGSVDYAPPTLAERLDDPRAQLAMSLMPIPVGRLGQLAKTAIQDRRINSVLNSPFWKTFGRRAGDQ